MLIRRLAYTEEGIPNMKVIHNSIYIKLPYFYTAFQITCALPTLSFGVEAIYLKYLYSILSSEQMETCLNVNVFKEKREGPGNYCLVSLTSISGKVL